MSRITVYWYRLKSFFSFSVVAPLHVSRKLHPKIKFTFNRIDQNCVDEFYKYVIIENHFCKLNFESFELCVVKQKPQHFSWQMFSSHILIIPLWTFCLRLQRPVTILVNFSLFCFSLFVISYICNNSILTENKNFFLYMAPMKCKFLLITTYSCVRKKWWRYLGNLRELIFRWIGYSRVFVNFAIMPGNSRNLGVFFFRKWFIIQHYPQDLGFLHLYGLDGLFSKYFWSHSFVRLRNYFEK